MTNIVNNLAKYYKQCLYEEAKISAFSNLRKEDNIVVKLNGYEKVFHNYPTPYTVQEESVALTKLMLKAEMDKKKQLLYGYMFITGQLEDGTEIYTPLVYADCKLERVNGRINVSVIENTVSLNLPALVQLISNAEDREILIDALSHIILEEHLTEDVIKDMELTLSDIVPNLDVTGKGNQKVHLNRENAVILTTINKGLANVISELQVLADEKTDVNKLTYTSLFDICYDNGDRYDINADHYDDLRSLPRTLPATTLDDSQLQAVKSAETNTITAITGGPGTGKTSTIVGIATDYILNGKTVLICSKQNSAVDVIYNKIYKVSPSLPIVARAGGKEYTKQLTEQLNNLLNDKYNLEYVNPVEKTVTLDAVREIYANNMMRAEVRRQERSLYNRYSRITDLYHAEENIIKKALIQVRRMKAYKEWNDCYEYLDKINKKSKNDVDFVNTKVHAVREIARVMLSAVVQDNDLRRRVTLLVKALEKNDKEKLSEYNDTFQLLTHSIPVWCVTSTDISNIIPLTAGLFDVVIIDEASLCDIATCLPLLYRAKRAVVVGDDKQLKYLSFLSHDINKANMESNNLEKYSFIANYVNNSIFDFANYFSSGHVLLKKQYRGEPEIMNFSSQKFYNGAITHAHKSCVQILKHIPVQITRVDGHTEAKKTVNTAEVSAIIKQIKEDLELSPTSTVGILSPFRDQVKYIESVVQKVFTLEEIQKHKITVGTAYSFQGEERSLMYISWTYADNTPIQCHTFINNPNLFNVSITRANLAIKNYISATELPKGLLREYVEYCDKVQKECLELRVKKSPATV